MNIFLINSNCQLKREVKIYGQIYHANLRQDLFQVKEVCVNFVANVLLTENDDRKED